MSALPPKADICSALAHVRFGPIADIARRRTICGTDCWERGRTISSFSSLHRLEPEPRRRSPFLSRRKTSKTVLGPFYRFGAPFQTKLAGPNEPGERLFVNGTVYSSDCRSRLPN